MPNQPEIRQCSRIQGNRLVFRNALVSDAEFILGLRTDPVKARHLSATDPSLEQQRAWLKAYSETKGQAYFVIENLEGLPVGTLRLYDAQGHSFCWGSWIKTDSAPPCFAMESALIVYAFAANLGFTKAHFDVRSNNKNVCAFHERLGAKLIRESSSDRYYEMDEHACSDLLEKYVRFLPNGIAVGHFLN